MDGDSETQRVYQRKFIKFSQSCTATKWISLSGYLIGALDSQETSQSRS